MTTTAGDIIRSSLRRIGQLAEGEYPSADTMIDAIRTLNVMLDSWSTERLQIFNTVDQVFTWPSGAAVRTIGPSGDFTGLRPITIDDTTYFKDPTNGVSYGVKIINQAQYDGIALKTVTATYPQYLWVNMDVPNAVMTVYPVPTRALEWHVISPQPLLVVSDQSQVLTLAPGHERAFRDNLAVELCAEFGVEPSPTLLRLAVTSKRNLKRINQSDDVMSLPPGIPGATKRFNIYNGE